MKNNEEIIKDYEIFRRTVEQAKDEHDAESNWATLEISMPKNKPIVKTPFLDFIANHPHMFPLLRQLIGI